MKYKKFIINKAQAIRQMNEWGKAKKPFFFMSSFDQTENLVLNDEMLSQAGIHYHLPSHNNDSILSSKTMALPQPILFKKEPISSQEYTISFDKIIAHLNFGNSYLVNLTKPSKINTNLTFEQIYRYSKAPYKLWIENKLVVFSPEIFIKAGKGKLSSYPMKGTIDAALNNAKAQILKDPKETAEHNTIVDLIRNDLSMVSKNVKVKHFRYVDEIKTPWKTLLQVSSKIEGEITSEFFQNLGDNFYRLLPAGSISGAPKKKTVDIIREAEQYDRGFYTGVFGYFDGESIDSAVMIRYMDMYDGQIVFKSGGGITIFSEAKKEYQELKDKVYVPIV